MEYQVGTKNDAFEKRSFDNCVVKNFLNLRNCRKMVQAFHSFQYVFCDVEGAQQADIRMLEIHHPQLVKCRAKKKKKPQTNHCHRNMLKPFAKKKILLPGF